MESMLIFFIVFIVAGFLGEFIAARIGNTIIHVVVLIISFLVPWLIFRPMGVDLLVAFIAWGIGAVVAYALMRGRVV